MLTVDFIAKRYGTLPSAVVSSGDRFDLEVAQIASGYEAYIMKNPGVKTDHGLTQDDMLAQLEAVRAANAKNKE